MNLRIAMAVSLILLLYFEDIALGSVSEPPLFSGLEFLDQALVSALAIKSVTVAISKHRPERDPSAKQAAPCLVETFSFDHRGNLVLWSPPLVGSQFGFVYDAHGELEDWSRNSSDGDLLLFREHYASIGVDSSKEFSQIKSFLNLYLEDRITSSSGHLRSVVSVCFNIDAAYNFDHNFGQNGSPKNAIALREWELNSGLWRAGSARKSPGEIYVYYKYDYWDGKRGD